MLEKNAEDNEKEKQEQIKDLIEFPINSEKEQFLLKIFPSKDRIGIIFILEQKYVKTYYYYGKFYLKDFKQKNKKFISDKNIFNAFLNLKEIIQTSICKLEKKSLKINLLFTKKSIDFGVTFTLRKKIVGQNRLNYQLIEEIQENKVKIKILKKQIAKLDKTIQNKNKIIEDINNNIGKITNKVNNLNLNICNNNNYLDNPKSNIAHEKEVEPEIKKIYINNKKENMLLKQNLSSKKIFQKNGQELERKRYTGNNRKKKNIDKSKEIKENKYIFKAEEKPNYKGDPNDTLFCFENGNILKNKKIYEIMIIFNIITVLIILYLLHIFLLFKVSLAFGDELKDKDLLEKMSFLSLLDDQEDDDDELLGIRDNIVDFQLNNNDGGKNNSKYSNNQNLRYINKSKAEPHFLYNEKEKNYYKKHIKKRLRRRVKDINLDLIFNSEQKYDFKNLNYITNISEILILIKTKKGEKFGAFCNNFISKNNIDNEDLSYYAGYIYSDEQINEIELREIVDDYGEYLKKIFYYFSKDEDDTISINPLGDIDFFEIYEIKNIK